MKNTPGCLGFLGDERLGVHNCVWSKYCWARRGSCQTGHPRYDARPLGQSQARPGSSGADGTKVASEVRTAIYRGAALNAVGAPLTGLYDVVHADEVCFVDISNPERQRRDHQPTLYVELLHIEAAYYQCAEIAMACCFHSDDC